eukprot:2888460-Prymnesium_polylepis.1
MAAGLLAGSPAAAAAAPISGWGSRAIRAASWPAIAPAAQELSAQQLRSCSPQQLLSCTPPSS